jgi:hypothetical protein
MKHLQERGDGMLDKKIGSDSFERFPLNGRTHQMRKNLFRKLLLILLGMCGAVLFFQFSTVQTSAFSLGMKCYELVNGRICF